MKSSTTTSMLYTITYSKIILNINYLLVQKLKFSIIQKIELFENEGAGNCTTIIHFGPLKQLAIKTKHKRSLRFASPPIISGF